MSNIFGNGLHKQFACATLLKPLILEPQPKHDAEKVDTMHSHTTYDDLDWQQLWENARAKKSWTAKGPADWDKKAASFARRNHDSRFVDLVLEHIPVDSRSTILDAGSGPGTLSLPLAARAKAVTAIDYSKGMLDLLESEAEKRGRDNITTILGSWEDDWEKLQVGKHDICIASRSLSVPDLGAAIAKLDAHATRYVFIVDRINPTPFDNGAFIALNRPFRSGPDYIYTINTLYSMDIHPSVDIISLDKTVTYPTMEEALDSYRWMFKDLTAEEEEKLLQYIMDNGHEEDGEITIKRSYPARWALIWWKKG